MSPDMYRTINAFANVGTLIVLVTMLAVVLWLLRDRSRSRASMDRIVEQARSLSEGGHHVSDRD